jgi:hypothetical protein
MAIQEASAVSFVVKWVHTCGSVRSIVSGYCQMDLVKRLTDLRCASVSLGSFVVMLTTVRATQLRFSGRIPFFSKTSVLDLGPPRGHGGQGVKLTCYLHLVPHLRSESHCGYSYGPFNIKVNIC